MDEFQIPLSLLSPSIDVDVLKITDTTELPPLEEPLEQARALEALDFGLNMKNRWETVATKNHEALTYSQRPLPKVLEHL